MSKAIHRREFLKGAAGVTVGAIAAGPAQALAAFAPGPKQVPTLHYWDGRQFVPASRLSSGDGTLDRVAITIVTHGNQGPLIGIDQIAFVASGKSTLEVPFHAWQPSPAGCSSVRFTAPAARGVRLRLQMTDGTADLPMVLGSTWNAKLREGTYALTLGSLSGFSLHEGETDTIANESGPRQAGYLLIKIERA